MVCPFEVVRRSGILSDNSLSVETVGSRMGAGDGHTNRLVTMARHEEGEAVAELSTNKILCRLVPWSRAQATVATACECQRLVEQ